MGTRQRYSVAEIVANGDETAGMALLGPWPNRGRNSVYGFIGEGWGNVT